MLRLEVDQLLTTHQHTLTALWRVTPRAGLVKGVRQYQTQPVSSEHCKKSE